MNLNVVKYNRYIRFRKVKLTDEERLKKVAAYLGVRLAQRFYGRIAGAATFELHELDRDNVIHNLITLVISVPILELSE